MTEQQADSLLRADLWERFEVFKGYGKDALLLTLLSYNAGVGRLLGYGKQGKSRLLRKIEQGQGLERTTQTQEGGVCSVFMFPDIQIPDIQSMVIVRASNYENRFIVYSIRLYNYK